MPRWADLFGDLLAVQVAAWLMALILLALAVGKAWPWLRKLMTLVDSLSALPGFMKRTEAELARQTKKIDEQTEQMVEQSAQIAEIHHEVNFNSGGTLKDAVARLDDKVRRLHPGGD